jgi:hypothetical protein
VPAVSGYNANWDDGNNWRASSKIKGSPNADDVYVAISEIVINEILSNSEIPQTDAIELYNPGTTAANIGGWYLSDNRSKPTKWKIPAGTSIPANGYKTFYEGRYVNSTLECDSTKEFGKAFSLSSHGETIYLFSGNSSGDLTGYEHGFDFGEIETGVTFGRHINSTGKEHFVAQTTPTISSMNEGPRVGPVVFNQIMFNPLPDLYEFIELVNTSSAAVDLFDQTNGTPWKVSGINFDFPAEVTLSSGESVYLVESAINPSDFRALYNIDGATKVYNYSGRLKNEGEEITLFKAAPQYIEEGALKIPYIRIDKVDYNDNESWADADGNGFALQRVSLNAYGNDPASWVATAGTIRIMTVVMARAIEKVFYSKQLIASGGTTPYTWSTTSGSLPLGLSLDPLTGRIEGTPTQTGTFNVTIKVEDQSGGSNTASLVLAVNQNTLPVAVNDTISTFMGISGIVSVLDNDLDNDGDMPFWVIAVSIQPGHGSVIVNADQTITYIPSLGFTGTDEFTYSVTDMKGSSLAKVIITVESYDVTAEFERRITNGSDDAEQNTLTFELLTTSTDLDLTYDPDYFREQVVGLRFQSMDIPAGVTIESAYIQFKTDKMSVDPVSLNIHGEKSLNATTFSIGADILSRLKTETMVNWQPQNWEVVAEESEMQRTADLSAVVQEIVDQPGWVSGNAMAFVISGTGTRMAQSYERNASGAPKLVITYSNVSSEAAIPVAVITPNTDFRRGSLVQLDGSSSYSTDNRMLNYFWILASKPEGSQAVLSNSRIAKPTFTPDVYGSYSITLKVDNGVNESEVVSQAIVLVNRAPVANAGADQQHTTGALIRLNGSGSTDPDGDPLTYAWGWSAQPSGSSAVLSNALSANPTFTADREGFYKLTLMVSDGFLSSTTDEIKITIADNKPPVAIVVCETTVNEGQLVTLDGSDSNDPEDDKLDYLWSIVSKPAGSNASLTNADQKEAAFTPDVSGSYSLKLRVSDGANTDEEIVQITVLPYNSVIAFNINASLKVYPNPFNDKIVVDYLSPVYQQVEFSLCTLSGAVVKRFVFNSSGSSSEILDFVNVKLHRGIYLLIMKPEAGQPRVVKVTHNGI